MQDFKAAPRLAGLNVTAQDCGLPLKRYIPRVSLRPLAGTQLLVHAMVDSGADYCICEETWTRATFGDSWVEKNVRFPVDSPSFILGNGQKTGACGLLNFPVILQGE